MDLLDQRPGVNSRTFSVAPSHLCATGLFHETGQHDLPNATRRCHFSTRHVAASHPISNPIFPDATTYVVAEGRCGGSDVRRRDVVGQGEEPVELRVLMTPGSEGSADENDLAFFTLPAAR